MKSWIWAANPSVVLVLHSYKNAVLMLQDFYGTSDKRREGILPMVAFSRYGGTSTTASPPHNNEARTPTD